jgi:hypothetical protein
VHSNYARTVLDCGLAYQMTRERAYVHKAQEILLAYADRYLSYPLHTIHNEPKIGGGRVGPQTLDESVWLIPVCQGADLLWEALDEDDREAIASKLLLPAAKEVILPHRMGVHNIQCWKNSAIGLVGFLLGDDELIHEAIENPERGYRRQMGEGVLPDGTWWEGAWGYHFYTLSALWGLTEAARNCGIDLYNDALQGMFDAPITLAMPDLKLPAFNDSDEVDLRGRASLYELGYARYGDPAYLALLATGDRQNDYALWFGIGETPERTPKVWESRNYPGSGYGILARGTGEDATWLCLKYGPHGGGHGHPDKLHFVLYARGRQIAIDSGTARYGLPIQGGWFRTTFAHNTLTVDHASQKAAEGACLSFGSNGGADYIVANAGTIGENVAFTRTVALLNENLLVFCDRIQCDRERTFDIAVHLRGAWETLPDGEPWHPPDEAGYRYCRDGRHSVRNGATLSARVDDGLRVAVTLAGGEPTEVFTATGIGHHQEDRVPVVFLRRHATETTFLWALSLDGRPVRLEVQSASTVHVADAEDNHWLLTWNLDGTLTAHSN